MQTEIVNLNDIVKQNHPYRTLLSIIDFAGLTKNITIKNNQETGRGGYDPLSCFKMLVLQFMEDLSDRELERFIAENTAAKLFCDFSLSEETPDHTLFCRLRQGIGTNQLATIFNQIREQLKQKGFIREIFTFVDSSQLISKIHLWNERDKAIAEGLEKFNNKIIEKNKNNTNLKIGDKGYCTKDSTDQMKIKNLHNCTIKTNNMKDKNHDKDKWISQARCPYERVFSKVRNRSRYRGMAKNQFQVFMESLAFNFKRILKLEIEPLVFVT